MPIFEYDCQSCGHRFETLVRDGRTPACPSCASGELSKRLSVFARPPSTAAAAELPEACRSCDSAGAPGCGLA